MTSPTYPLSTVPPSRGTITLALTQEITPENPVLGDLDIQNGQIHLWDKRTARIQKIRFVLQFGLGEHWLNPDEGIPWFGTIIGQRFGRARKNIITGVFRSAFLKTLPDLSEILQISVDFDPETRAITPTFALRFDDNMVINSADFGPLEIGI